MKKLLLFACGLFLAGCTVGPKYHRPAVNPPAAYRGETPEVTSAAGAESLGNEKWWTVFQDPVLQQLIRTALKQNYDVQIAATRVLQAQAELGITRANQYPVVTGGADVYTQRNPKVSSSFPGYEAHAGEIDLSAIWNLDFWGKYRRQTEAARANMLATEWGRRAVLTSVVSSVATAYFQLRELDLTLDISQKTLASRQNSLRLVNVLAEHGSASKLEVSQAEQLVYTAGAAIPDIQRQIAQQENALSVLLGQNPAAIPRGQGITDETLLPTVPVGLPSELLERRPDIREAEETLVAANAEIGVAKAALFPNIALTGTAGLESYALKNLFSTNAGVWDAAASLTQPVFQAGALRAGMRLVEAQKQQMLLAYKQSIVDAFQQVSDALVAYQKDREYLQQVQSLTSATQDSNRLSNFLYQHGGASYLQVLTSETNYFSAQLTLAQAQLNERLALVQLYAALGGGWQQ